MNQRLMYSAAILAGLLPSFFVYGTIKPWHSCENSQLICYQYCGIPIVEEPKCFSLENGQLIPYTRCLKEPILGQRCNPVSRKMYCDDSGQWVECIEQYFQDRYCEVEVCYRMFLPVANKCVED